MNIQKLKNFADKQATNKGIAHQATYDSFFFEQFLKRLSRSEFKNSFVFKGGFLLGNIVGIEQRTTLDMDLEYRESNIDKNKLFGIIENICEVNLNDEVSYHIVSIDEIMEEQKYSGISIKIQGKFGNLKKVFSIDIANNDQITPSPSVYKYKSLFDEEDFEVLSYNIETILAEKFHATISKGLINSRSKDLYDIYLLVNEKQYDANVLHDAIINTFIFRRTSIKKEYIRETLESIKKSKIQKERFENYSKKNKYTESVSFNDVMDACVKLSNNIKYIDYQFKGNIDILLIRHGEDELGKLGGWSNLKLTDNGKKQIEVLANKILIKENDFDLIISSDSERTKETAGIISKILDVNVTYNDNLREINNGDLANLSTEEFKQKYPGLFFASLGYTQKYPNGESPVDFFNRVKDCFQNIVSKYKDMKIIIVTHGGVIGIIESIANGIVWSNRQKYNVKYAECKHLSIKNGLLKLEDFEK